MKTTIYYYTGTGNSLWAARKLGAEIKGAQVKAMRRAAPEQDSSEAVGLVFPVHIWGVPRHVRDFVNRLPTGGKPKYYFALATNGGQVSGTLVQLAALMKERGLTLAAGYDVLMPSNYIPWGGALPPLEQETRFAAAAKKIMDIAPALGRGETGPVEKGPLWQRLVFGICYRLTYTKVPGMDSKFFADEKCNGCAICTTVCPGGDIIINGGKPAWQGRCEQCLACIQWCPLEAIQYGPKTAAYTRYHHPQVTLSDMRA